MMRIVWRWFVITCCLALLGGVTFAGNPLARPAKREARDHLDRGNRLYNTRSFDEAIIEYKAGALVESATVFDYNLAQAYRQVGKYAEAIWHYERFLDEGHPDQELADAVNAFLKEMRAQLANRAQTMPPTNAAPADAEAGKVSRQDPSSSHEARSVSSSAEMTIARPSRTDWLGWGITGMGVVAIGSASAVLLSASHLSDQANMESDVQHRHQLRDQASTRNTIGLVVGIGGVALAASGIVKLVLHGREPARPRAAAWDVGVSSNGAFVTGRF